MQDGDSDGDSDGDGSISPRPAANLAVPHDCPRRTASTRARRRRRANESGADLRLPRGTIAAASMDGAPRCAAADSLGMTRRSRLGVRTCVRCRRNIRGEVMCVDIQVRASLPRSTLSASIGLRSPWARGDPALGRCSAHMAGGGCVRAVPVLVRPPELLRRASHVKCRSRGAARASKDGGRRDEREERIAFSPATGQGYPSSPHGIMHTLRRVSHDPRARRVESE